MMIDLYVHAMVDVTDRDLECFFSIDPDTKWGGSGKECRERNTTRGCRHVKAVTESPAFWAGQVSLFEDHEGDPVKIVETLLEDFPVTLDDKLAETLIETMNGPGEFTDRDQGVEGDTMGKWMARHMGQRLFMVKW